MAITVTDVLNLHPFVPNPALQSPYPVGIWKAAITQVTDASGGVFRWVIGPQSAAQGSKYLWSLEAFSFITSVCTADIGLYVEVNTGEVVSRAAGLEVMRLGVELSVLQAYRPNMLAGVYGGSQDVRLGFIHQPGGGNTNSYILEATNVNAQVYTAAFWGYFWNSAARRLASGPLRPSAR